MRVLVTGSNGLLGQHLTTNLLEKDVVLLATSFGSNRIDSVENCYERLDISDYQETFKIIASFKPDVVINTAAATNVDECEHEKKKCNEINCQGVKNLLSAFKELQVSPYFIHLSTDFIFDGNKMVYSENDQPNPISEYGRSKWLGEEAILKSDFKNYAIVRTSLVYGVGKALNKGNIFLWAMEKLRNGEVLTIVDDQFRSPTYVKDLARACLTLTAKKYLGIINIAGPETRSMFDYIVKTAEYVGVDPNNVTPISSEKLAQLAKRPPCSGLDITTATREINYNPTPFKVSLAEMDSAS
jgi:dTDP-4-dehydrorhamnose reductase